MQEENGDCIEAHLSLGSLQTLQHALAGISVALSCHYHSLPPGKALESQANMVIRFVKFSCIDKINAQFQGSQQDLASLFRREIPLERTNGQGAETQFGNMEAATAEFCVLQT
jgi:hypothetical protein